MIRKALFVVALTLVSNPAQAAKSPESKASAQSTGPQQAPWLLSSFLKISSQDPARLLKIARVLFSEERVRISTLESSKAFEWQHRLAMVSALSDLFDSKAKRSRASSREERKEARDLIVQTLIKDPSLVVRDGAAETIRRIIRMRPQERFVWKKPLENAFLRAENVLNEEGFFIRTTILTALREAALTPSKKVMKAAQKDRNPRVQEALKAWNTQAYDQL